MGWASRPSFKHGRDGHPTITIKIVSYLIRDPKHINCRAARAGISAAFRLIAMLAQWQFKGCILIFLASTALSSQLPSRKIGTKSDGAIRLTAIASLARTRAAPIDVRNRLLRLSHNKYSSFQLD
ncbi:MULTISPECIES: hypothetical protein [unclassified Microcoleus]|uniref:hypothetical protein n=1 Tax=unclassified Microcoleus TaxID=2642155 RepID=UPI002FD370E2